MSTETAPTALATTPAAKPAAPKPALNMGAQGIQLTNIAEALRFAEAIVQSGLAPKNDTAQMVLIKLQAGLELGFTPMRAMAALCVVNGRLSIMGVGLLAKIRAAKIARVQTFNEGEGQARAGVFEFERFDTGEKGRVTFTMADAKKAGLLDKSGTPWVSGYADDMLIWRAVSRGANRYFSDITMGLEVVESARDFPERSAEATPVVDRTPPTEPDPLLAEGWSKPAPPPDGGMASHSDVEIPPMTHAEADAALAAEDAGEGRLFPETKRRPRG